MKSVQVDLMKCEQLNTVYIGLKKCIYMQINRREMKFNLCLQKEFNCYNISVQLKAYVGS